MTDQIKEKTSAQNQLAETDPFPFQCRRELPCFNRCCRDVNIYLTPIDIVELRRALGITSSEFLREYTVPLFPKEIGHPIIVLRMTGPDKTCVFAGEQGCQVYQARPWSCRSFPLEPDDRSTGGGGFRVVRRDFCRGMGQSAVQSVAEWRESQDVALHEALNNLWATVTHHPGIDRLNLLEGSGRDMFFLGSYNPDEFRNMVYNTDFLQYFDVTRDILQRAREDDIELLGLAFRWLRTVLFGDGSLPRKQRSSSA